MYNCHTSGKKRYLSASAMHRDSLEQREREREKKNKTKMAN